MKASELMLVFVANAAVGAFATFFVFLTISGRTIDGLMCAICAILLRILLEIRGWRVHHDSEIRGSKAPPLHQEDGKR